MATLGYDVFEVFRDGRLRLEIQKEDDVGAYESDRDAVIAAINDTLGGNTTAAGILRRVLLQEFGR